MKIELWKRVKNLFAGPQPGKDVKTGKNFLELLKEYFEWKAKKGLSKSTIEKHNYFYSNVVDFFQCKEIQNYTLPDIRISTMEEMRAWLHSNKQRTQEHVSRHLEHCVAAMDYAVYMEYTDKNRIHVIKAVRDKPKEPVSLTVSEIKLLTGYTAKSFTERLAVHLFLFQCFTGLSFIDLWHFEIIERRGKKLIYGGRGKNGKKYWAEFNKYARAIYNEYVGEPAEGGTDGANTFPLICNQVYNKTLRKVAWRLGIKKHLTTHVGRKTYATLKWNRGQSLESIAVELGNTPEMVKRRYITEGPDRIINEMNRLEKIPLLLDE